MRCGPRRCWCRRFFGRIWIELPSPASLFWYRFATGRLATLWRPGNAQISIISLDRMLLASIAVTEATRRGNSEGAMMMWHVVFAEPDGLPQSRAARSRDSAIQVACELLDQSYDVRRIIEPHGLSIERPELDAHYDEGRFPGLRCLVPAARVLA
jgi:hypothetical protein